MICYLMGSVFPLLSTTKLPRTKDKEEEQRVCKSPRMMQAYKRYIPEKIMIKINIASHEPSLRLVILKSYQGLIDFKMLRGKKNENSRNGYL